MGLCPVEVVGAAGIAYTASWALPGARLGEGEGLVSGAGRDGMGHPRAVAVVAGVVGQGLPACRPRPTLEDDAQAQVGVEQSAAESATPTPTATRRPQTRRAAPAGGGGCQLGRAAGRNR